MKNSRRKIEEHDNSHERWLVSYADFITLMFAFFVILYATSERDVEKQKKFQNSIEKFLIKAGSFGETGAKIEQGEKNFSVIEPPIQSFRQNVADEGKLLDAIQTRIESQLTDAERKKYLIDIFPEEKGVRVILSAKDMFAAGSAKFSARALAFVDHFGAIVLSEKKPVMIEGHVPAGDHGTFASPWDLASQRSVNFLRYVSKKYQMPENRFAVSSFGDTRPLAASKKASDIRSNDRLELLFYFNDAEF